MKSPLTHDEVKDIARSIDALAAPAPQRPPPVFQRVVVATDGEPASEAALAWARVLASDAARAWVVHVAGTDEQRADVARVLENARNALSPSRVEAICAYGEPVREILNLASDVMADLIIVGTANKRGLERALVGSVSDGIRHKAKPSVLIARALPTDGLVLAPVDGSPHSTRAAGLAARLAARLGRGLTLLHVRDEEDAPPVGSLWHDDAPPSLREVVESGDPAQRIVETAAIERATLIVMGARGLGRMRSALLGSVSDKVTRDASTNVLVVRQAA